MFSEWITQNVLLFTVLVVFFIVLMFYLWKKQTENIVSASMVKSTFAGALRDKLYQDVPRPDGMTVVDLALEKKMMSSE